MLETVVRPAFATQLQTQPELSIIIALFSDGRYLARCLGALLPQAEGRSVEIIVPYGATAAVGGLAGAYPQVRFVEMGPLKVAARPGTHGARHEIYDYRISYGLRLAAGRVIALLQDYDTVAPDWLAQVLEAHRSLPHAAIGGAVEHEQPGLLNWAAYFLDFGRYQLPLPEGPVGYLTDINLSYKREALASIRPLWQDRYNEAAVNWALAQRGGVLWQRPAIVVYQERGRLSLPDLLRERFAGGRLFGSVRAGRLSGAGRLFYAALGVAIPFVVLGRLARKVFSTRRNRLAFVRSLPLLIVLSGAWGLGEYAGLITGRAASV